jgi:hypothetical protein
MIQEQLFDTPVTVAGSAKIPPTNPPTIAQPLGSCCKRGCSEPATLLSPGGSIYCAEHGKCGHWYIDRQARCGMSVEKFVWYERLGIWCCPCLLKFEIEFESVDGRGTNP